MKRIGLILLAGVLGAGLWGCQKDDAAINEKLDQIDKRLASIDDQLKQGAAAGAARGNPGQRPPRPSQPDPQAVYAVPVEGAPYEGAENAKITVVKAFEFACPFCEKVRPTMAQLLKDYGDDIKIVAKHYVVHPQQATLPAQAACAAHLQGKYKEMEELLWDKAYKAGRDFSAGNIDKLAQEAGLDLNKLKADMAGKCTQVVRTDQAQLAQLGVRGTPAFFINGRYLSGARPVHMFKAIVDEELKKANERIAQGTPVDKYYEEWVIKKGQKKIE